MAAAAAGRPVLWFDVFPTKFLAPTLESINKNPADYVFWLKPVQAAYDGHFNMKQKIPPLLVIDNLLQSKIDDKFYKIIYFKPIISGDFQELPLEYKKSSLSSVSYVFNCVFCSQIFFDKNQDYILSHNFLNQDKNIVNINFKNKFYAIKFMEEYYLSPKNADFNVFLILEKNR